MSEEDPPSMSHVSLELTYKDSLKVESCSIASEISQDEVQDSRRKSEPDCTLYKEDHLYEPLFEHFIYDFEDASEKLMSPLTTLRTCPMNKVVNKDSAFSTEWKESNEELLSRGELEQQGKVLGWPKENCRVGEEDSSQKNSWELMTENTMLTKEFAPDMSDTPIQEDLFMIMGESLLDCIVKESPIKEVSSFLTQSVGSLFKTNAGSSDETLLIQWDGSNVGEKTLSHEGNVMNSGQHNESTKDIELTISPDALDENLDYIRTLMQSNRHLKERLKSNLAHCINKEKVAECTSPPQSVDIVSKGDHNAGETSWSLHSTKSLLVAEECQQGDAGDKATFTPYTTKSCCLMPYEASHKLCRRSPPEFSSKQLLLQEGDMDFSRVIKDLEQDQQKQLSCIVNLQYDNIFFEKKMKEMEKVLLQEGDVDLNKAIQGLEQDQKKQQTQIMDLYYDHVSLGTKIKELEVGFLKKHSFINTIKQLKENIADLTKTKNKVMEEKNEAERHLKGMKVMLANTEDHLQVFGSEKMTLMLQLEKLHADYSVLQAKHQAEVEQKDQYMNQCAKLECALRKKEQEIQELFCLQQELEHEIRSATSTLHELREERDTAEEHLTSLQAEMQKQMGERQAEREELSCRYNQLIAQIKTLQVAFENERAEMEKMQQQVCAFRTENSELQRQVAKDKEQNRFLQLESARWKEQHDQIRESQTLKEQMQYQMIQVLRHKVGSQREELRKKEEIIEWKMHVLGRFLLDMKSVHSDVAIRSLHSEDHFNSPYVQKASHLLSKIRSLLALTEGLLTCQDTDKQTIAECSTKSETDIELKEKMKNLSWKKKALEKELQKHKENIAAIRSLIVEKSSEDQDTEATGAGDEESDNDADLPDLLRTKLGEYHKESDELHGEIKELEGNLASKEEACKKVTGENDKLQKDLGSLTCKVTSYEEIIECADQRLELASSEILYLEKRNQDLEDLIKKFKMKTRKLRRRWSSFFSQMLIQGDFQRLGGTHLVTKEQTIKYAECDCQCHRSKVCLQMTY